MESTEDKQWASKYLLDPLTATQPHQETGPGTCFSSTVEPKKEPPVTTYPTPPTSASPSRSTFASNNPYSSTRRQQAGGYAEDGPSKKPEKDKLAFDGRGHGRKRGSSLGERFPGDMSHRPLDLIRKEVKAADRAPHLRKKHIPGADIIDSLDRSVFGGAYHHGGPYDATLLARNRSLDISPVAAVKASNDEALKATPREHIRDALDKHMPLQGTANIPPGVHDMSGQTLDYEEGADLMREADAPGGAYRRWPGVSYHPDDLKGKGEPSYTIEKALKTHRNEVNSHRRVVSDGDNAFEMQPRPRSALARQRSASGTGNDLAPNSPLSSASMVRFDSVVGRRHTTGRRVGEGLKKRFGSFRRSKKGSGDI